MQYTMGCVDCLKEWTTAFGIVGMTQIAEPTTECPHCHSKNILRLDKRLPPHCARCERQMVTKDGYVYHCDCHPDNLSLSIG